LVDLFITYSVTELKDAMTDLIHSDSRRILDMCGNCTIWWLNVWDDIGGITPYDFALDDIGKALDG
jgi:hypothetical protein